MVNLLQVKRAEARKRKVLNELGADQREITKHIRIGKALDQMRLILKDETFSKLIHTFGIESMPSLLSQPADLATDTLDRSLDFLVAWRFFAPWLHDPMTTMVLDTRWPGFGLELRDLFISIVSDGPFPHERRGRDRRTL